MFWKTKPVLITGAAGFSGRHLVHDLQCHSARIAGFDVVSGSPNGAIASFTGSLLDRERIEEVVSKVRSEVVFHLAGVIRTNLPEQYYSINAGGTAALLEAIARLQDRPRVVLVSSSAVYGEAGGDRPVSEGQSLRPLSSYGHSKLAMEWIAKGYQTTFEIPIVVCRPFNLVGPGLKADMVLSSFARQIACAERGLQKTIRVGNLDARRDFLDVRDGVRAYRLAAEHGRPGETYNVCSGRAVSIRDCLEMLLSFSDVQPEIVHDTQRRQKDDIPVQIGDLSRIKTHTDWEPRIPLEQSLKDLLDDWRARPESCE